MTLVTMGEFYELTASGTYVVLGSSGKLLAERLMEVGAFVDLHERIADDVLRRKLSGLTRNVEPEGAVVFSDVLLGGMSYEDERSLPLVMARLSLLLGTLAKVLQENAGLIVVFGPDGGGRLPEEPFLAPIGALVRTFDCGRGKSLRTNVLAVTEDADGQYEGRITDAIVYLMMESMVTGLTLRLGDRYLHAVR